MKRQRCQVDRFNIILLTVKALAADKLTTSRIINWVNNGMMVRIQPSFQPKEMGGRAADISMWKQGFQ